MRRTYLDSVSDRSKDQPDHGWILAERWSAPSLIGHPVHRDERFAGGRIRDRTKAIRGKAVVQTEDDELWLPEDIEMREPTPLRRIHSTVRVTPAMEAEITDHVWDPAELLA